MSETGNAGQPQRTCQDCGNEIRPGNRFCVSCGKLVALDDGEPAAKNSGFTTSSGDFGLHTQRGPGDNPRDKLLGFVRKVRSRKPARAILPMLVVASAVYMLVAHTAQLAILALVACATVAVFGAQLGARERHWVYATIRQQYVATGVLLLAIIWSTPFLVPLMGAVLSGAITVLRTLVIVAVVAAVVVGLLAVLVWIYKADVKAREAHSRWYNGLSTQEKLLYHAEKQSQMKELG